MQPRFTHFSKDMAMARSTDLDSTAPRSIAKEDRARDAAQAMQQYVDEERALLARTEKLRALRLAREAAPVSPVPAPVRKTARTKKAAGGDD